MGSYSDRLPNVRNLLYCARSIARRLKDNFARLVEVFRTTENWWGAFAAYFGIITNVSVRLRDTSISFPLTRKNWRDYWLLRKILLSSNIRYLGGDRFRFSHRKGLEFDYHDNALNFYAHGAGMQCYRNDSNDVLCEVAGLKFIVPFPNGTFELREIFIDKIYGEPYCQNAVVVDVGAFIGDSSLFFASRGAKLVVAFEPIPALFEILNKNVALNGLENVIHTKNEAVSDISEIVDVRYNQPWPGASGESPMEEASTFKVASVPLSEVITSLEWVDILKMDCEGCEHKALQHAAKTGALKHVGMIVMEVHSEVRNIPKLLKDNGFTVIELRRVPGPINKKVWTLSAQRSCCRCGRLVA